MAKRALSQSLARELGPRGVHVSHVIVDGAVDNPNTRKFFSEKNPDFLREFEKKSKLQEQNTVFNMLLKSPLKGKRRRLGDKYDIY